MPIVAEVLDKEPSIVSIWMLFGAIALVGFAVCRWRWWFAPVCLVVALIFVSVLFEEFSSVGLLTSSESPSFVAQFYVAAVCAVLLPVIGAIINFRKDKSV